MAFCMEMTEFAIGCHLHYSIGVFLIEDHLSQEGLVHDAGARCPSLPVSYHCPSPYRCIPPNSQTLDASSLCIYESSPTPCLVVQLPIEFASLEIDPVFLNRHAQILHSQDCPALRTSTLSTSTITASLHS